MLHGLHFLDRVADSLDDAQRFAEWLQQSPSSEGFVSGLGGRHVFFPVDEVMELGAVQAGAQLVHNALLRPSEREHHTFYKNNLLQELSLVNVADLTGDLRRGIVTPLSYEIGDAADDQRVLDALFGLDGRLAADVALYEATLVRALPERLVDWKRAVEDHLDAAINREVAGFVVALRFLDAVSIHVKSMLNIAFQPRSVDTSEPFLAARRALRKLPEGTALAVRGAVGAVAACTAGGISAPGAMPIALMLGAPIVILGISGVLHHLRNTQWQRALTTLRNRLDEKWEALMEGVVHRVARSILEDFSRHLDELRNELDQASGRMTEVVQWFQQRYTPTLPEASAVLWPLLQARSELLVYAETCLPPEAVPAKDFTQAGGVLWRRFAPPDTAEPNAFEWDLIGRAALNVLPGCRHLADI